MTTYNKAIPVEVFLPIKEMFPDALADLNAARNRVKALEEDLTFKMRGHPRVEAIRDLTKASSRLVQAYPLTLSIVGDDLRCAGTAYATVEMKAANVVQTMSPATLNLMLNSTLLTQAEKRSLVKHMLPDVVQEDTETAELERAKADAARRRKINELRGLIGSQ